MTGAVAGFAAADADEAAAAGPVAGAGDPHAVSRAPAVPARTVVSMARRLIGPDRGCMFIPPLHRQGSCGDTNSGVSIWLAWARASYRALRRPANSDPVAHRHQRRPSHSTRPDWLTTRDAASLSFQEGTIAPSASPIAGRYSPNNGSIRMVYKGRSSWRRQRGANVRSRRLGRTGLTVSEIGFGGAPAGLTNYLGTWDAASDEAGQQIVQTVRRAAELGVTYFDSAPGYGNGRSEELMGQGLRGFRDRVTVATKVTGDTADDILRSVEASLKRLGVDQIDVMQYHGGWYTDELVQRMLAPGGALEGMQKARDAGLVRFIGFTTEGANGPASALLRTGAFDVMQICYNLIFQHPYDPSRQAGLIYDAAALDIGIITMRSLTSGTFQRW